MTFGCKKCNIVSIYNTTKKKLAHSPVWKVVFKAVSSFRIIDVTVSQDLDRPQKVPANNMTVSQIKPGQLIAELWKCFGKHHNEKANKDVAERNAAHGEKQREGKGVLSVFVVKLIVVHIGE